MQTCPTCQKPLSPLATTSGVDYAICLDCGGRAMPLPLVEKALTPITFKRLVNHYRSSRVFSEFECPECLAKMKSVEIEILTRPATLEICSKCQTVWFHFREFEDLPHSPESETEFRLPGEMQDALNQIEVRKGRVIANRQSFRFDARDFGLGWDREREGQPGGWRFLLGIFGIPVERDLNVAHPPWVTWSLIALVSIVSILGFADLAIIESLGVRGGELMKWNGLTTLTYFFVHGGWEHLLGNLYYLWLFGDNVEDELGPWTTLGVLAAGTIGGAILHGWADPNRESLLVGASGGISTLGMIYMLRFPRAKLAFFAIFRWVRVPAYVLMVVWIALQLKGAVDQIEGITQVSALCHVGGAAIGALAYLIMMKQPGRKRF